MEDQVICRCKLCGRAFDEDTLEIIDETENKVKENEWSICDDCYNEVGI